MVLPKTRTILYASGRLGSYFPVSMALMHWRETPTASASSACDHSFSARHTRSFVFTRTALQRKKVPHSRKPPSQRGEDMGKDRAFQSCAAEQSRPTLAGGQSKQIRSLC